MKKAIATLLATSILAGCATPPSQLHAKRMSPTPYSDYNCQQLNAEYNSQAERKDYLEKELQTLAHNDAFQLTLGMLLLWPALLLLEGGDGPMADEYSEVKGEMNALESVAIEKQCPAFVATETVEETNEPTEKSVDPKDGEWVRCGMYKTCLVEKK